MLTVPRTPRHIGIKLLLLRIAELVYRRQHPRPAVSISGTFHARRLRQLSGALPGQRVPRPDLLGRRAGQYLRFAHRADGGQRLPAEAQRPDAVKILRAQHLAGGMPQECLWHILPLDAAAVIGHTDEPYPAVSDLHRDGGRPGID